MVGIRKLVGYGATTAGLGVLVALTLAQSAQAAGVRTSVMAGLDSGNSLRAESSVSPTPQCTAALNALQSAFKADATEDAAERAAAKTSTDPADATEDQSEQASIQSLRNAARTACLAPATPQCTAAINALKAARAQDVTEDAAERAAAKATGEPATDATEDQAEIAALKPLAAAVRSACAPREIEPEGAPAPTAQCTTARNALKAEMAKLMADKAAEASTQFTPADQAEDQAEWAQVTALAKAAAQACGFDHDGFDSFRTGTGFSTTDQNRRR